MTLPSPRHSCEGRNPGEATYSFWIPAFAGNDGWGVRWRVVYAVTKKVWEKLKIENHFGIHMTTVYDKIPYHDEPFLSTHPNTLAGIGTLFGLNPAAAENCRFLELGAAKGSNIIAMAISYPDSHFTGIELAANQVKQGQEVIEKLGLSNCSLLQMDLLDVTENFGEFDYIVSHGVLSWVPVPVRDKIFEICGKLLSPHGLSYLSYNTYPGWKSRDVLREIMLFEAKGVENLDEQVKNSRRSLEIMKFILSANNSPLALQLKEELPAFIGRPDWYFIHDFLAEINNPFYISEIFNFAESAGLQYVSDTELHMNTTQGLTPEAQKLLHQLHGDLRRYEQYSDIARLRAFRRSVFAKKGAPINRARDLEKLRNLHVAARFKVEQPNPENPSITRYRHPSGGAIDIADPVLKQALDKIQNTWPGAVSVNELADEAARNFPADENKNPANIVLECMLKGLFAGILETRTSAGPIATSLPEKPAVSALARMQTMEHITDANGIVTSLLHTQVAISPEQKELLIMLDGTRTRKDLNVPQIASEEELGRHLSYFVSEGLIHA